LTKNNIVGIKDYLFPPQIRGGRTPLSPFIGSLSAPLLPPPFSWLLCTVATTIAVAMAATAAVAVAVAAIAVAIAATAAVAIAIARGCTGEFPARRMKKNLFGFMYATKIVRASRANLAFSPPPPSPILSNTMFK
jgi:hypothetical protein